MQKIKRSKLTYGERAAIAFIVTVGLFHAKQIVYWLIGTAIAWFPATYFLEPVNAYLSRPELDITLVRRTEASRDFPWIEVSAHRTGEARFLSEPFRTCPMPPGASVYEPVGQSNDQYGHSSDPRPLDTVTFDASWIAPCVNSHDTIYRVTYDIEVTFTSGPFSGWTWIHPERVNLVSIFPATETHHD